ncbi:hypothetical protein SAMN05421504_103264 [Amycolatopsis xylanica]|uniref:Uncharacterized protein n=1 Tax=Amycolatopsis xylanica TaxID=589385 RepID=A0A1H3D751_9PSEU|nr:DUF6222 family protein [Amycolatopsis xylanica]SDX61574.1 hypothetical protein SAMN05421504_103264 [Amycolatopsis xylanica]
MTTNEASAETTETEEISLLMFQPAPVRTPQLARGLRWSDVVAEIERDKDRLGRAA